MKIGTSTTLTAAILMAFAATACSDSTPSPSGADGGGPATCTTCAGANAPTWALEDFQPKSDKFETTYGLEAYRGKVLVVALLAGW
jgi:hypothetical protein